MNYYLSFVNANCYLICLRDKEVRMVKGESWTDAGGVRSRVELLCQRSPDEDHGCLIAAHMCRQMALRDRTLVAPDVVHSHTKSHQLASHLL